MAQYLIYKWTDELSEPIEKAFNEKNKRIIEKKKKKHNKQSKSQRSKCSIDKKIFVFLPKTARRSQRGLNKIYWNEQNKTSTKKMSAFTETALIKKLLELNASQQSIQTLSLWLIHHRKHYANIVKSWYKELMKGNTHQSSLIKTRLTVSL